MRPSALLPLVLTLSAPLLLARAPAPPAPPAPLRATGFSSSGGALAGLGPNYRLRLLDGVAEFTPALGEGNPAPVSVRLALESIRRGQRVLVADPEPAAPRAEGALALYDRAFGVTERYALRADGVELSYVFAAPPPGAGDLAVRMRLDGAAAPRELPDGGIALELPGRGGVTIGGVTGIDAAGARAAGTLSLEGGRLEMRLPAEFVDRAAYPLVLDPLIGPSFAVGTGPDDFHPDVAFDSYSDCWLAVWQVAFAGGDVEVRGQRLDAAGSFLGGAFLIAGGPGLICRRPSAAGVSAMDAFLVAWEQSAAPFGPFAIACASVAGDTGAVSASEVLTAPGQDCRDPDVAGGWTSGDLYGFVVHEEVGAGIRADVLALPDAFGGFSHVATTALSYGPFDREPAISKSGGNAQRYAVVWTSGAPDSDIHGAVIDEVGTLVGPEFALTSGPAVDRRPDVDGFSYEFGLAFERSNPAAPGSEALMAQAFRYFAGEYTSAGDVVAGIAADVRHPAVATTDHYHYVAWVQANPGADDALAMAAIGIVSGSICETRVLESSSALLDSVEMASRQQGGALQENTLLLGWTGFSASTSFIGEVRAAFFDASGGAVEDLGGGCGPGGSSSAVDQPMIGNASFAAYVEGLHPNASVALFNVAAPGTPPLLCGGCAWIPFQFTLVVPVHQGGALLPLPLPCDHSLIGFQADLQWTSLFAPGSTCPLLPKAGVSNAVRVTIGGL